MKAADIFELDEILFIEPAFADLIYDYYSAELAGINGNHAKILVDEAENLLSVAIGDDNSWVAGSFHLRQPSVQVIERCEQLDAEIYQENRGTWEDAVRGYFSEKIMKEVNPSFDEFNPERKNMVKDLISECLGSLDGKSCLDCCCGSGIGSSVMREFGASPVSYDNDPELISRGLVSGRLKPERCMLIDGTKLSMYTKRSEIGIGLMFGEIIQFNQEIWQQIFAQALLCTEKCMVTVGTEPESALIKGWAKALDKTAEVFENERDPIYDRWVCIIE